jgi:hypothetical protein
MDLRRLGQKIVAENSLSKEATAAEMVMPTTFLRALTTPIGGL